MDTKNIPVSIYAQYKCLPFLFNKQFTTHPLTVNLLAACTLIGISLSSGNLCVKLGWAVVTGHFSVQ
jgi:hypothetical protein